MIDSHFCLIYNCVYLYYIVLLFMSNFIVLNYCTMRRIIFSLLSIFTITSSFALNEYQIKSNECYGNGNDDRLAEIYQINDTTFATIISFENRYGYFPSNTDNSTWIVKLDKNYKIISKTKINNEYYYNSVYTFDPITKSISIINPPIGSNSQISDIKIYSLLDASLKLTIPTNNDTFAYTTRNIYVNPTGGFTYNFRIVSDYDSIRVIVVDSTLQLWCNKILPTNYFDNTYALLDVINLSLIDKHQWLSDIYYDKDYLYGSSFVHTAASINGEGKTAIVLHKLDKNLNTLNTKVISYSDSIANFQLEYTAGAFFKLKNNFVYRDLKSSFSAAFYLFDTSLTLINKVIPPNNNKSRYFYNEFIYGDRLYIPTWFGSSPYESHLFSYDENLNLIHDELLDTIFGQYFGNSSSIISYKPLADSGFLFSFSGSYNGMNNRFYVRANNEGKIIWKCPMTDNYLWKTKKLFSENSFSRYTSLNFSNTPVIEEFFSRQTAFYDYRIYLDQSYGSLKDTSLIVEYKINLDNGKIIDTNIITSAITTNGSKVIYFNKVRKVENDKYALLGTSNQFCTGRGIDLFSATSSKNFNTIVSKVFLDVNNNSILDNNEHYLENISINITKNNSTTESIFTENGYIINYIDTGKFEINVNHNINYFTSLPLYISISYTSFGNIDTLLFALQPIENVNDLMVQLNSNGRGRPGFNGSYLLNIINNGTTIRNALAKLNLSNNIDSIYTIPSSTINNDTLFWLFDNMQPNEQKTVEIYFHYKIPPINNIGDTLVSVVSVFPISNDTFPENNISTLQDVLSGSYDPNDKIANKMEYTLADFNKNEYIKFTIRFENTGNDTAFKIIILDTLDNNLDANTFLPLKGKYNYTSKISDRNIVSFTFDPIRLPEHTTSSVSYLVKPKNGIANGYSIKNKASIKFDYNEPITTNTTQTRVSVLTDYIQHKSLFNNFILYPNPASNKIVVEFYNTSNSINYLQISDIFGHVVKNITVEKGDKFLNIDIQDFSAGLYILYTINGTEKTKSIVFVVTK